MGEVAASLVLVIVLFAGLLVGYKAIIASAEESSLWVDRGLWVISHDRQVERLVLVEALIWPWVVILTLNPEDNQAGLTRGRFFNFKTRYLVVMSDSVSCADFRALCRWLRICVPRQRH